MNHALSTRYPSFLAHHMSRAPRQVLQRHESLPVKCLVPRTVPCTHHVPLDSQSSAYLDKSAALHEQRRVEFFQLQRVQTKQQGQARSSFSIQTKRGIQVTLHGELCSMSTLAITCRRHVHRLACLPVRLNPRSSSCLVLTFSPRFIRR